LDYLIDDGPHNFEEFKGTGLIFDMPYNKSMKENASRIRVKSWEDVLNFFVEEMHFEEYADWHIREMSRKGDNANEYMKRHGGIYEKS
jgi:hypothetical protein